MCGVKGQCEGKYGIVSHDTIASQKNHSLFPQRLFLAGAGTPSVGDIRTHSEWPYRRDDATAGSSGLPAAGRRRRRDYTAVVVSMKGERMRRLKRYRCDDVDQTEPFQNQDYGPEKDDTGKSVTNSVQPWEWFLLQISCKLP